MRWVDLSCTGRVPGAYRARLGPGVTGSGGEGGISGEGSQATFITLFDLMHVVHTLRRFVRPSTFARTF